MSKTMTVSTDITVDGQRLSGSVAQTASGELSHHDTIANAGISGTLSTRTDANTGVLTVAEGHGVTAADTVDIYWTGGVQIGVDVTSVTGTTISFDLGTGDDLPVEDTVIIVGVTEDVAFVVTGADVKGLAIACNRRCHVDFQDAGGSELPLEIINSGAWHWTYDSGVTNPITGDSIIIVRVSCGETTAGVLQVTCLYDDTP